MTVKPEIIDEKKFKLLGCVFYGDPFHSAAEWTYENEIGKLWMRFYTLMQKYFVLISKIIVDQDVAYEIHIEPEEYIKTKRYYVFVGMEVSNIEEIPVEMFLKILPNTKYLKFTTKVTERDTCEDVFKNWIPKNGFEQAHPYVIQGYDRKRYKDLNDPKSEIDWYIPVRKV
jgi:AraC family transcriptional regulator